MTSGYESIEDIYTHIQVCRNCIHDENIFNSFKRNSQYTRVLEHCSFDIAKIAIQVLKSKIDLNLIEWEKIRENDSIGNPVLYDFGEFMEDEVKINNYLFSPSTIQYVYQAHNILEDFTKKDNKKDITITEIGGGYGGLCKIINDIASLFGLTISKYYLIDLPDVCAHQDKYLKRLGLKNYTVVRCDEDNVKKYISNHDLCVSIYALGEFTNKTIQFYVDNVIKYSNHVYFWWNMSKLHPYFKNYKKNKTGILHNHPHGLDLKISD